jgi:hypothetical protein
MSAQRQHMGSAWVLEFTALAVVPASALALWLGGSVDPVLLALLALMLGGPVSLYLWRIAGLVPRSTYSPGLVLILWAIVLVGLCVACRVGAGRPSAFDGMGALLISAIEVGALSIVWHIYARRAGLRGSPPGEDS